MGDHSLPEPKRDLTPEQRRRIYDVIVILSGILVPLASALGVTLDQSVPAVIVAVAGSLLGGGASILARRNVPGAGG